MTPPSDKCKLCNWWTLLGEIRDEIEDSILAKRHNQYTFDYRNSVISMYNRAIFKVIKEHWEGKR